MNTTRVSDSDHSYANARWLIKLRWVAVIGQMVTIIGSIWLFQMKIPMAWAMASVIAVTIISNVAMAIWIARWQQNDAKTEHQSVDEHRPWNLTLGLVLIMDILSLTTLLFATGGPNNPFCLFFFVNLSLSALLLNRYWAWAINLLTFCCFALLQYEHHHIPQLNSGLEPISGTGIVSILHTGLLVAFGTCSSVIVYFMTRLTDELHDQQKQIRRVQQLQANSDKVEALGTLAAGTAHELATPLSTIAIVARDVEQAFEQHPPEFPGAEDVIDDVHLIRRELDRCRKIIDRMSSHAGETIGESIEKISVKDISLLSIEGIVDQHRVRLSLPSDAANRFLSVPRDAFCQAMRALIQNGIDADEQNRQVTIDVSFKNKHWGWSICDQGDGMSDEQLKRVSEPFFTTKPPGKGMGLGVFLAKNVVGRLGGKIEFETRLGKGTTVRVLLPESD
jgi:two-component system sensor histidine kinase RegB